LSLQYCTSHVLSAFKGLNILEREWMSSSGYDDPRLLPSVEVFVVQTMSYINYELDLGGPGLGHSDTSCDIITIPLRDPRG
jgi:hypothetical protein